MGKRTRQGHKERFLKANMNLKAQILGATILPKVRSAEMEPRAAPTSARARRKDAACVVYCFISSLQSFGNPPVQLSQPLTSAWRFRVPGLAFFGLKLGKIQFVFPVRLTQKLLIGVHNHTWAAPGASCFIAPTSCAGACGCRIGEMTSCFF